MTTYRDRSHALNDKVVRDLTQLDTQRDADIEQARRNITGNYAIQKYQLVRGAAGAMGVEIDGDWDFTLSKDNRRLIGKRKPKSKPGTVNAGDTGTSNVVPLKGRKKQRKAS